MGKPSLKKLDDKNSGLDPKLLKTIRGWFQTGSVYRIELRHFTGSEAGRVRIWAEAEFENKNPDQIAAEIWDTAEEDSSNFRSVSTYAVLLWREEKGSMSARTFIRLRPEEIDSIEESEPANERGRMSQIMRHDESFIRTAVNLINYNLEMSQRRIESQDRLIEKFADKHIFMMEAIEKLLDRSAERELRINREKKLENVAEKAFGKLEMLMPSVLGKLLPESSQGQLATAELSELLDSLTESQVKVLVSTLTEEQSLKLIQVKESLDAAKKAKQTNGS
jgi:hypothetical protein